MVASISINYDMERTQIFVLIADLVPGIKNVDSPLYPVYQTLQSKLSKEG